MINLAWWMLPLRTPLFSSLPLKNCAGSKRRERQCKRIWYSTAIWKRSIRLSSWTITPQRWKSRYSATRSLSSWSRCPSHTIRGSIITRAICSKESIMHKMEALYKHCMHRMWCPWLRCQRVKTSLRHILVRGRGRRWSNRKARVNWWKWHRRSIKKKCRWDRRLILMDWAYLRRKVAPRDIAVHFQRVTVRS